MASAQLARDYPARSWFGGLGQRRLEPNRDRWRDGTPVGIIGPTLEGLDAGVTVTDLEAVTQELEGFKTCARADIARHLSPALRRFRFIPAAERRACAEDLERWAGSSGNTVPVKHAYAVFMLAMDRFMPEEHEAALHLLTQARTEFADADEGDGLGLCAMLIGAIYRTLGHYELALKTLWEGHDLLTASGQYPVFLAANANSMANIDLDLGHLDEALAMFQTTLDESTRADDFYFKVYALHGLARVFRRQGHRAEALARLEEALRLSEASGHPLQISNSLTELASFRLDAGDLDEAESLNTRALSIREEHHLQGGAITNCVRLSEIYERRERWDDAIAVLHRALAIAEELKVKPKIAQVHECLSRVWERKGRPEDSLAHARRFHDLREQVAREDGARRLVDAKLVFEAEQTRKENAVIKRQKAEIEQKNRELQDTIDELTRARIGRMARAMTLALMVVLFVFQDAILGTALRLLNSDNYFALLAVKMGIIFSLAPVNRSIERYLLRRVTRRRRSAQAQAANLASSP